MKRISLTVAVSTLTLVATAWSAAPSGAVTTSSGIGPGPHHLKPKTSTATSAPAIITGAMTDHGGPVQTAPRVYVDYWGWGSDPSGEQAYLNRFLGSVGGTSWLATVNQYGGGSPSGVLAGTWSDPAAVPAVPSDAQLQAEAATAAGHFGAGTSVNVQIVVATPTGHSTSGFGSSYCAYHGAVSSMPNVTYTDLPYMSDAGSNCGENTVNAGAAGVLDGVSIVEGHELAETITDPLINAWYDSGKNEIGDKCAWYNLGNVNLSGNTFAMQPLWSNAANTCMMASGAGGPGPNLLQNPSFEGSDAGWQTFTPTGGTTNMVDYNTAAGAPAQAHDGSWYLAFNTNANGGSAFQDVAVNGAAGSSWEGSAWLAAQSGTASGVLCVWGLGATNANTCKAYSVGTTYQFIQVVFAATQPVSTVRFQVYPTPNGGTTDMDTTTLAADRLTAGSFEQNTTGWQPFVPAGGTTNIVDYNTASGAPAPAQDGSGYLAFNTNGSGGSVYQDIIVNAVAGASYTASVWLSAQSGSASGTFCLWGLSSSSTNTCENYNVTAGTYTYLSLVYTAPQAISGLRFQIYPTPNGGTTDMDTAAVLAN